MNVWVPGQTPRKGVGGLESIFISIPLYHPNRRAAPGAGRNQGSNLFSLVPNDRRDESERPALRDPS